jgi:hypothetical protein
VVAVSGDYTAAQVTNAFDITAGNTITTGAQDFGAATSFKIRVAAGLTAATNGFIGYDSTANMLHAAQSGADAMIPQFTITPSNGDCVKWAVSGSNYKIDTAGAACGTAAGLGDPGGNGVVVRTALNVTTNRTVTGTANQITVVNGDGVAGNPTLSFPASLAFSSINNITTTGTGVPIIGWKSNVLAQSTSQSTVTLATAPAAGDYTLYYIVDLNTPCTTGGNSVSFAFNWTDASNARTLSTGTFTMAAAQSTTAFMNGIIPIHVGSGNVTYTSTVAGTCASGTSSYDINTWLVRVN